MCMVRRHRRPKRDRLAVRESEQRVRADIRALHDKIDQLSRRSVRTGLAGLGIAVLAWIFPRQGQPRRDVHISGGGRDAVSGGGTPQVVNRDFSAHVVLGPPRVTVKAEVVPTETPTTGRAGGRHKTRRV